MKLFNLFKLKKSNSWRNEPIFKYLFEQQKETLRQNFFSDADELICTEVPCGKGNLNIHWFRCWYIQKYYLAKKIEIEV